MNKEEYLNKLTKLVRKLPKDDREDIISDYEEHFRIGIENGRTEEEISKALGNPEIVARQIRAEYMIKKAEDKPSASSILEAVLAVTALGILNLVFVAIPALGVGAIILSLVVTGFVVIFMGILTILSPILQPIFPQYIHLPIHAGIVGTLIMIVGGIGLILVGTFLVVIMTYVAKWFYNIAIRYLKSNLRSIKERTEIFN